MNNLPVPYGMSTTDDLTRDEMTWTVVIRPVQTHTEPPVLHQVLSVLKIKISLCTFSPTEVRLL